MLAKDKLTLARFIDLTAAVEGSGYREQECDYNFCDDAEPVGLLKQTQKRIDEVSADNTSNDSLEKIAADIQKCEACGLCKTRKNTVPGEGSPKPLVMVIGEGPGADEDITGRPFVGKAGQLLDKMLLAIGLQRESNAFIANVIKCRPPANRDPQPQETEACSVFLARQVRLLKPHFILGAGRIAGQALLKTGDPIGALRGRIINLNIADMSIPFVATYHPSALLRNEDWKRPAWEDLKLLRSALVEAKLMNNVV